ncbi:MAG: serine/threonine protein kinase [Acidobacteria bacterium]|nr:serine/threonine protein kinase [Acidobacteriota bacterium]
MFLSNAIVGHLRDVATWPDLADGRYTDVRPLGSGGMGRVFAALDEPLGREVAIKISHAPVLGSDLDARLRQEARVLAQLEHPGIVPVHDLGLLGDGRVFYVMKLVRGQTLAQSQPPATESAALSVFERVADAVAFAHAHEVIHLDLKPSNIMTGAFGEVLVMDWGVAKILSSPISTSAPSELRRTSLSSPAPKVAGTPGFMAPEQAAGGAVGPASDVYALGALLFWLLRGDGPPRRLPRRLRAIITMCLVTDPAHRYPDASAVVADLARYRAGDAVHALPETVVDRAVRFGAKHITIIVLIAAYLVMRALVALWR